MTDQLCITEHKKWLRPGNGLLFQVTDATITAQALKTKLGATLNYRDAIDTGDVILLPITPYIYTNPDNELSIANLVMVGDSLSHLQLAPSQRIHVYWIDDINQALCAQVYFNAMLPAQLSDTRKQLAIIKRADGQELKLLNKVYGQDLTDRALCEIVNKSLKHNLDKVKQTDIQAYRESIRGTTSVHAKKKLPAQPSTGLEQNVQSDVIETTDDSTAPKQLSSDHPTTTVISEDVGMKKLMSWLHGELPKIENSSAQANWDRLGLESILKLTLPQLLEELGCNNTPEQVAQGEEIIETYPASYGSDKLTLALTLLDELNAQCGINTDTIKRRLKARENT